MRIGPERTSWFAVSSRRGRGVAGQVFALLLLLGPISTTARGPEHSAEPQSGPTIVMTQVPVEPAGDRRTELADSLLPVEDLAGARIVLHSPGEPLRLLSQGFHSAADPEISFDGLRLLFAAKRSATDPWNIYEMALDGTGLRPVAEVDGNCRQPVYLGSFYTIVSAEPWNQFAFVSDLAGEIEEYGDRPSTSLYTCRLDGSGIQRIVYNPSSERDPGVLPDGRLLFSSWQRSTLDRGLEGRVSLFAAQTDGLDFSIFAGDEGRRVKLMPCVTTDRRVVFVEGRRVARDGSGSLASVSLRRNLHSHRPITTAADGWFHSPSPFSDGSVLVSRRPADGSGTHGVFRLDLDTAVSELLFDDPEFDDIQAKLVASRLRPDGRSSVVSSKFPTGVLYGLDVHESDLAGRGWIPRGTPLRLRVLEGLPRRARSSTVTFRTGKPPTGDYATPHHHPLLPRRILGEIDVEPDGSFNIEVPPDIPIALQLIDEAGLALRTCSWLWVRNRETRGCIGCHEDGERAPPNRFVGALQRSSTPLTLPPDKRRGIDFRRDVMPILERSCAATACHGDGRTEPILVGPPVADGQDYSQAYASLLEGSWLDSAAPSPTGRHVHPGRARTSPLIWKILGRATARPWDADPERPAVAPIPHEGSPPLTDTEKRTLFEWIDLGAHWAGDDRSDGRPATSRSKGEDPP